MSQEVIKAALQAGAFGVLMYILYLGYELDVKRFENQNELRGHFAKIVSECVK